MSRRLSEEQLDAYRRLVALLLPAAHGMPDGLSVGVATSGLETVLKLRPELAPDLLRALRLFASDGLPALEADDDAWHAARIFAYAAYYLAPEVQAILRYTGQIAQPFDADEAPGWLASGLLDPVRARGPIWTDPEA